ncbi:hypothetical protein BESB_060450 [Besnoitia besnoiti]|uniref:Uncharacterized protein n=1 Tax=Besnoitia besnoiti TaxID=94643 RepID=A0A2A9M9K2_BESBE|nr:hypothetical protein BESB_060450 [Besnoitia besnoiti]PFH35158.1 hypothetical protein BESB_060450 [Besnoitia besnoiti]
MKAHQAVAHARHFPSFSLWGVFVVFIFFGSLASSAPLSGAEEARKPESALRQKATTQLTPSATTSPPPSSPLLPSSSPPSPSSPFSSFTDSVASASRSKSKSLFGIAWISDLHLDPLYSPTARVSACCRVPASAVSPAESGFDREKENHPSQPGGRQSLPREEASGRADAPAMGQAWFEEETNPNIGRGGCDTPPLLFELLLESVERETRARASRPTKERTADGEKKKNPELAGAEARGFTTETDFPTGDDEEYEATAKRASGVVATSTTEYAAGGARRRELFPVEARWSEGRDADEVNAEDVFENTDDTPLEALLLTGDFAAHYDDSDPDNRMSAIREATQALFSRFSSRAPPAASSLFSASSSLRFEKEEEASRGGSQATAQRRLRAQRDSRARRGGKGGAAKKATKASRAASRREHHEPRVDEEGEILTDSSAEELQVGSEGASDAGRSADASADPASPLQMIFVVGNNDLPADYHIPDTLNAWSVALYKLWKPILPADPETKETFERGLFYRTRLAARPQLRVLCLNTVFYSRLAWEVARDLLQKTGMTYEKRGETDILEGSDPAGQFAWMERELQDARDNREQVLLVGHVPPGVTLHFRSVLEHIQQWRDPFVERYRALVLRYSDVVVAHLYGHVHADTLRVLSSPQSPPSAPDSPSGSAASAAFEDSASSALAAPSPPASSNDGGALCDAWGPQPLQALLTAPAVSPVHGNNPAWRALFFAVQGDSRGAARGAARVFLRDYVQFYLPLYGFLALPLAATQRPPRLDFSREYAFASTYSLPCVSGRALARLAHAFAASPLLFGLYTWHTESGGKEVSNRLRMCEARVGTTREYLQCLTSLGGGQPA